MNMCIYTEHLWNTISQHIDLKSKNKSLSTSHGCWVGNRVGFAGEGSPQKKKLLVRVSPVSKVDNEHMNKKKSKKCQGARRNCTKNHEVRTTQVSCGGFFACKKTWRNGYCVMKCCRFFFCSPVVFFEKNLCLEVIITVRQIWQYMLS